ncbi:protein PAXX isoform X1 [Ascaphus truei]|uniref:protein PAXX isoform X1 n=1 Tax=Ascaphus truei TaxID=8439 RepID=UPI003F593349
MDPQPQPRRWSPLCTVSHGGQQYLCHSSSLSTQSDGGMQIHVTDGIEVWRAELTEEILEEWKITNSGLSPSQDSSEKLRETFQRNAPLLEVQGSLASLTIPLDSGNVTIDLFKVPISEARSHLQAVMFDLADRVRNLEKLLRAAEGTASASVSPVKPTQRNQFLLIPGKRLLREWILKRFEHPMNVLDHTHTRHLQVRASTSTGCGCHLDVIGREFQNRSLCSQTTTWSWGPISSFVTQMMDYQKNDSSASHF